MDVQLTATQRLLSDSVRDWLRQRWPESAARRYFEDGIVPEPLWNELSALGWLSVGVSEDGGGSGVSLSDVVTLQEQLGAALFPTLVGSTLLVARLVDRSARHPQRDALLSSLVAGSAPATIAVQERTGGFLTPPSTRLIRRGEAWELSGEKWFVRDAARARLIAVRATVDGSSEAVWAIVDSAAAGVTSTPQEGAGHDGQHRITFDAVAVAADHVLSGDDRDVLADAMVMEAARLTGIGIRAHALAVEYAKTRVQFGRPIGSFQAIQHKVADITTDVESSSLTTYYAAYCVDGGEAPFLHALTAKLWAGEAIQRAVREAHQIHGGIAYITEHPLHLYFRNALTGALLFGAPKELIPAIAGEVLTS